MLEVGSTCNEIKERIHRIRETQQDRELLKAENAKLRKEIELLGHIAMSNVAASVGREEALEEECEKLRQIALELLCSYGSLGGEHYEYYRNLLRELGVEVHE